MTGRQAVGLVARREITQRVFDYSEGHPPAVRLTGELAGLAGAGEHIRISLSHTAGRALAVALRSARLPEDPAQLPEAAVPAAGPPEVPARKTGRVT